MRPAQDFVAGRDSVIAKAVDKHGRPGNGTSNVDYLPDELDRKATIHAKPFHCQWQDHQICLLDTPGFADFYGDTMAAIRAADAAIVVVDGVTGVEVGTRRIWKLLDSMQKPRLVFVSKLDKENSDFFKSRRADPAGVREELHPV